MTFYVTFCFQFSFKCDQFFPGSHPLGGIGGKFSVILSSLASYLGNLSCHSAKTENQHGINVSWSLSVVYYCYLATYWYFLMELGFSMGFWRISDMWFQHGWKVREKDLVLLSAHVAYTKLNWSNSVRFSLNINIQKQTNKQKTWRLGFKIINGMLSRYCLNSCDKEREGRFNKQQIKIFQASSHKGSEFETYVNTGERKKKADFVYLILWYSVGKLHAFLCKNISHPTSLMHMHYVP